MLLWTISQQAYAVDNNKKKQKFKKTKNKHLDGSYYRLLLINQLVIVLYMLSYKSVIFFLIYLQITLESLNCKVI